MPTILTPQQAQQLVTQSLGSMLYKPGQRGFTVDTTFDAVVLTYRSESGRAINVPTAKMQSLQNLLSQKFIGLDADPFYGYCETVRRKQGLGSRWKAIQEAQKADKSSILNFEILDADPARRGPLPANPRQIGDKPAKELPRIYTWIRSRGSGENAEHWRTLIFTEHQFGD